jgi:hypothetical protein
MTNILDPNATVQNSKSLVFTIAAYCLISYSSPRITYATTDTNANIRKIPTTEAVHLSEPLKVPQPVRTFVILSSTKHMRIGLTRNTSLSSKGMHTIFNQIS